MTEKNSTKERSYIEAVGRRKEAVVRVRISAGTKTSFLINNRKVEDYFPTLELRNIIEKPITVANNDKTYAITAVAKGGGVHAQAEALALGLARALVKSDAELKSPIKKEKLLSRDARSKERRKFGLKKARKAPQWSKR